MGCYGFNKIDLLSKALYCKLKRMTVSICCNVTHCNHMLQKLVKKQNKTIEVPGSRVML